MRRIPTGLVIAMRRYATLLFLIAVCSHSGAFAAEGDLDPSFGFNNVWGSIEERIPDDLRLRIAVDGYGRTVVAGVDESTDEIYLARFHSSPFHGLDAGFGSSGIAGLGILHGPDLGLDLVLQDDGKILRAGVGGSSLQAFVARCDAFGALDPAFGTGGVAYAIMSSDPGSRVAVAVQTDEGILLATRNSEDSRVVLTRFTSAGIFDAQTTHDVFVADPAGLDLALHVDGKILLGARDNLLGDGIVACFDASLVLDPAFGTGGIANLGPVAFTTDVAVATDGWGRTYLTAVHQAEGRVFAARLDFTGAVDSGFGSGGIVTAPPYSTSDAGCGLDVLDDGSFVLAGHDSTTAEVFICRYDETGAPDTGFGDAGHMSYPASDACDFAVAVDISHDGTIYVCGARDSSGPARIFAGRTDAEGIPIGTGVARYFSSNIPGHAMLVDQNDIIRIASHFGIHYGVAGYYPDGYPLGYWGINGIAYFYNIFPPSSAPSLPFDLAMSGDQEVLLASIHADQHFVQPMAAYGEIPPLMYSGLFTFDHSPVAVATQADGMVILAGADPSMQQTYLARFDETGTLDTSFDSDGIVHTGISFQLSADGLDVAVQPDGHLLLAGFAVTDHEGFVMRFDETGTPDATFGSSGVAYTGIPTEYTAYSQVAMQPLPDGGVLLSGYELDSGENYIVRLDPDGVVDTDFGDGGIARPGVATGFETEVFLIRQPDGRLLLSGTNVEGDLRSYVARFTADGALDTTFGDGGVTYLNFESFTGGLGQQSDGKIIVSGYSADMGGLFVARLLASTTGTAVEESPPHARAEVTVFPNPFNPSTTIRYALPDRAHVRLAVYDAGGREVAVLRDEVQAPGRQEARWDGIDDRGQPQGAGVYFARLDTGVETRFAKMIMVK